MSTAASESSSEADDEAFRLDGTVEIDDGYRQAQYEGEDTRVTSSKELWGWYAYGFAAEVFVVCGIGSFIPITLEQLSRENGVLHSDHQTPCTVSKNRTVPSLLLLGSAQRVASPDGQCVIYFLGLEINTASFALFAFSISVVVQVLVVISISYAADHGSHRKQLLLGFGFTGAIATMLFLFITPGVYLLGALLAIVANTCFGASFVLLNSYLPVLVRNHPSTHGRSSTVGSKCGTRPSSPRETNMENAEELVESRESLLVSSTNSTVANDSISSKMTVATKISSFGMGIGYLAALSVQIFAIFLVLSQGSSVFSLRLVIFVVGLWWFIFTIPAAIWLRPRRGPPLNLLPGTSSLLTCYNYLTRSWISLYLTLVHAIRLRDITLFLLAWFFLSDAIATVSSTAILFAKTQLLMEPAFLALINVIATAAGILGAFAWPIMARYLHLTPIHVVLACIALFELIPLYGLLSYIPAVRRLGWLGLQQPWEMYPLGFIVGFVLGGVSSYCRALFGELIPAGSEAAFYALYAITDKGSSAFGPAIVGAIINYTGQIRSAFWFLAFLIALPAPLLWWIDVKRGGREGRIMSEGVRHAVDGVPSATSSPPSGDSSRERGRTINARE